MTVYPLSVFSTFVDLNVAFGLSFTPKKSGFLRWAVSFSSSL